MPKRMATILGALVLTAFVAATAFVLVSRRPQANPIRLRDGTLLQFRASTFERMHSPTIGPRVPAWFRQHAPDRLLSLLGVMNAGCTVSSGDSTNLMVWVTGTRGDPPKDVGSLSGLEFEVDDGHGGIVTGQQNATCSLFPRSGGVGASSLFGIVFDPFPRRHPTLTFRVRDTRGVVGEFRFPNPARGPFPEWKPGSLPQSVVQDGVEFRLERLERVEQTNTSPPIVYHNEHLSALVDGKPTDRWQHSSTRFQDPTGNSSYRGAPDNEPVWKAATLWFENPRSVDPASVIRLRDVPVPAPGQRLPFTAVGTVGGVTLRFTGVVGVGTYTWSNNVLVRSSTNQPSGNGSSVTDNGRVRTETQDCYAPHLLYTVSGLPDDGRVSARGHDDKGRDITASTYGGYRGERVLALGFEPGAKSLDLEVIPQLPRHVDFLFTPRFTRVQRRQFRSRLSPFPRSRGRCRGADVGRA